MRLLPPQIIDCRFVKNARDRWFYCDWCYLPFQYGTQKLQFDGRYVTHHGLYGPDPMRDWRNGKDFRWWCINCWAAYYESDDLDAGRDDLGLLVHGKKRVKRAADGRRKGY